MKPVAYQPSASHSPFLPISPDASRPGSAHDTPGSACPQAPNPGPADSSPYIHTSNSRINTSTLEETLRCITPEFPYTTDLCTLHTLPGRAFPWHWHKEVELFYLQKGTLDYILPDGQHTFRQGEGGFLNSGVLHMTCCPKNQVCIQEEHLFLPSFLGGQENSILTARYITPVLEHPDMELYRLDPAVPDHAEIIRLMKASFTCYESAREGYEFEVREYMSRVWRILFSHLKDFHGDKKKRPHSDRIKTMMEFISFHYHEKLTLKQIADSAFISPRECSRCFQETLGQPPFSYLTDYRLHKACSLLTHTHLSVTQVSAACGFNSSSYFAQIFHRTFGCTPREYGRQNHTGV